jgi:hypothetical protein
MPPANGWRPECGASVAEVLENPIEALAAKRAALAA